MKKLYSMFTVVVILMATSFLAAQTNGTGTHRSNSQIVEFILDLQEREVLGVAAAMPAEKYPFVPTGKGFRGVRSFAEQLRHIAADNYLLGAGILGENPPVDVGSGESGSNTVRTKAEITAYVKNSFDYMHRASAAINDNREVIPTPRISPWPDGTATRLGIAVEDCVHTWDHYGQLVEYLRMNGIVPPASRK